MQKQRQIAVVGLFLSIVMTFMGIVIGEGGKNIDIAAILYGVLLVVLIGFSWYSRKTILGTILACFTASLIIFGAGLVYGHFNNPEIESPEKHTVPVAKRMDRPFEEKQKPKDSDKIEKKAGIEFLKADFKP